MVLEDFFESILGRQLISSLLLIAAIFLARWAAGRLVRGRDKMDAEQRRRILSNIKNALFIVLVIGLLFIWAPALRTFALSIAAFAVAIIIATKEVILCVSGSFVKASSGAMRVGDWIEFNGIRGEVIDQSLMSTTLLELGQGASRYELTGRTIVVPNSAFVTTTVTNERMHRNFVYLHIAIIVESNVDTGPVIEAMTAKLQELTADGEEVAKRYKSRIESSNDYTLPDIEPEVHIATTNEARPKISVRAFVPTKSAVDIEREVQLAGLAAARNAATEAS